MSTAAKPMQSSSLVTAFEFAILGAPTPEQRAELEMSINSLLNEFETAKTVSFFNASNVSSASKRDNFVVVYFGNEGYSDKSSVLDLLEGKFPVIPVFQSTNEFESQIPEELRKILGFKLREVGENQTDKNQMNELARIMLESVRLLNRKRKVFISYVHEQSRGLALQLHAKLLERKFAVFLDTHIIRFGEDLENTLIQQIIESDVMIMLDTSKYSENKWTQLELNTALTRRIAIFRLVCSKNQENSKYGPTEIFPLSHSDFVADHENTDCRTDYTKILHQLTDDKIEKVIDQIETLRRKSVFEQFDQLVEYLYRSTTENGLTPVGLGANLSLTIRLNDGTVRHIFPRLGFPTSIIMNEIDNNIEKFGDDEIPILTYNDDCFTEFWDNHLDWLNKEIKAIEVVKMCDIDKIMESFL